MSDSGFLSRLFGRRRGRPVLPGETETGVPQTNPEGDAMSSEGLHEPIAKLSHEALNLHRAIVSLMEELEAVDWYNQRAEGATDEELRKILIHNRDEEIEHAVMVLEWLRRNHPVFDKEMRERLFKDGPIGKD